MSFTIKPASRTGVKPIISLYSESGCGKTYSSLLLARGLAGPSGKIVMIDTESGRGSLYADVLPGGYETILFDPPFSPARYIESIEVVEKSAADILIIDSMSHEWENAGGVLDMAGDNEQRSGKSGLHNWKTPKLEHSKLVLALLRTRLPVICCLRAKYKSRQIKDERGKTQIVKDDHTSPIQAEDFIFESTAHAEILPNHSIHLTKCSHPTLRDCFPADGKEPIGIKHGELLAKWCNNPGATPAKQPPATGADADTRKRMIARFAGFEQDALGYAIDAAILMPNETLEDWPLDKIPTGIKALTALIDKIEAWKGVAA